MARLVKIRRHRLPGCLSPLLRNGEPRLRAEVQAVVIRSRYAFLSIKEIRASSSAENGPFKPSRILFLHSVSFLIIVGWTRPEGLGEHISLFSPYESLAIRLLQNPHMVGPWTQVLIVVSSDQLRPLPDRGLVEVLGLLLDLRVVSSRTWSFELGSADRLPFLLRKGKLFVLETARSPGTCESAV